VYLKNIVIPEFADRSKNEIMHIWSAGCSTGEEPYSISITLNEALKKNPKIRVKIIATDIDSKVLGRAAAGINTIERVAGLKKNELKHWFLKGTGKNHGFVRLKPEIRKIIEFGQLNLMENSQLETMQDLVFFRNVLIYFDRASKMKLINRIADHLKEGGYLFIGHSESLFKLTDRFELIGQTIYRKIK
jgi:chemotaxis protein methyltransferase CheR